MNHRKRLEKIGKRWRFEPKFGKKYDNLWDDLLKALAAVERETLERVLCLSVGTIKNPWYGKGEHLVIPWSALDSCIQDSQAPEVALGTSPEAQDGQESYVGSVEDCSQDPETYFNYRRIVETNKMISYQFSYDGINWVEGEVFLEESKE